MTIRPVIVECNKKTPERKHIQPLKNKNKNKINGFLKIMYRTFIALPYSIVGEYNRL